MKFHKLIRLLLAIVIAIPFPTFVYDFGNHAHAETATDPAPFIQHKGDFKGKVLFDNTHGETAGAADWVIDGGFSDFANAIADQGYDVTELRKTTPITYDDLKDYKVFILGEANIPFKASEQDALLQYAQNGGSIFFIGDHYNSDRNLNRWDSGEVYNGFRRGAFGDPTKGMSAEEASSPAMQGVTSTDWLGQNFGIRFRSNALGDVTSGETVVPPSDSFGITQGVTTVEMHAGSTLAILDPTKAKGLIYLPEGTPSWGDNAVDQGVYNGGGIDEGAFAAIAKVGKGKAAFIGDSSPVEDPTTKYLREDNGQPKTTYDGFLGEGQDATFLTNTVLWLAQQEDYTSFEGKVSLSPVTQLYDWEQPQNTTEPEAEPWSAPPAGYKWWDPTTFADGSYGSPVDPKLQPIYRFIHDPIPSTGNFDLTVSIDNLDPNQTLTNLKLGMYLAGGTQVAMFQNSDGTWPTSYGYSNTFSVTADGAGHASITLKGLIKDGTNGTVSIRLKQGSNNLYTESTVVGEATAISIKDARAQGTGTVTVEGVITTNPGTWGSKGFYLEDETGGIYVYQSDASFKLGEKIKITGSLSTYNGELELSNQKVEVIGQTNLPEPIVVTTVDDTNQGQVLKLQDVTVQNIGSPDKYGTFEFDAVNEGTTTRVRVDNRSGVKLDDFKAAHPEGSTLDITGVGSIFNSTYQLKPRFSDDFTEANSEYVTPLSTISDARAMLDNSKVSVEGVITTPLGIWGSKGFYLQDETGGVYVFQGDASFHPGEKVKLIATKTTYNGEVELSNIEVSLDEGNSTLPDAKVVTTVDDSNQGQVVKLHGVTVANLGTADKYGTFEFDAVNGDTTTRVRVDGRSGVNYDDFVSKYPEGSVLDITGIGSVFKGTYQLKPRSADDFAVADQGGDDSNYVNVQLLGLNDLHGKIDQHYKDLDINGDKTPDGTFGGADYLAAYIKQKEAEQPNTLLVGAGDLIGGSSPVSALFQDEPTVDILNQMGMDVATPGNHEFDEGLTEFERMVNGGDYPLDDVTRPYAGMNFPVVAANIVYKDTGKLVFDPYVVKEVQGEKVAFIGVDTPATAGMVMPDGIKDIKFTDPAEAINNAVKDLNAQGIHSIIVLAHCPAHQDDNGVITDEAANIAENVSDDVDVIFAAHNHEVDNGLVDGKLIVEANEYGKAFSDVNLTIDPATHDIVNKTGNIVWVNDENVQPDAEVGSILNKYEDEVQTKLNEVEGTAAIDMNGGYGVKGAVGDNALGNLIADGMRAAMHSDFALMNGGGIRDNLKKGDITWNDLFNIQPFGNTLVKVEVTGADFKEILRRQLSAKYGPDYSVSGFKYTWTMNGDEPEIVDVVLPNGKKIDDKATYTLTVNNFMASATAYKYAVISQNGKNPVQGPTDVDATVDFVKNYGKPLAYKAEGRISEIYTVTPQVTSSNGTTTATVTDDQIAQNKDGAALVLDLNNVTDQKVKVSLTADQVSALIAQGAPIVVKKGDISINLPIENLTTGQPLEFSITKRTDLKDKKILGTVYDFTLKQGDTTISTFKTPVTLTFNVDPTEVTNPDDVKIYYYNESTHKWELIGGTYADGIITATTGHFSTYAVREVKSDQGNNGGNDNGNGNGNTNDQGNNGNNNDQGTTTNDQGDSLPKTATNTYNMLLLGALLIVAGLTLFIFARRRKSLKNA